MKPGGVFHIPSLGLRIPNITVREGTTAFLGMMFRDDQSVVAGGANFYMGLCGEAGVSDTATLADLTDELSEINGYARQPIARSAVGWPVLDVINSQSHAQTLSVRFQAAGGDFSGSYSRIFLCNVLSGTVGTLLSISGKIDPAILIRDGEFQDIKYDYYW